MVGNEPAHGRRRAVARVIQRSDHVAQPRFSRPSVGVHENHDFYFRRQLANGVNQIVDFFPPAFRLAGEKHVCLDAGLRSDAANGACGGVGFRSEDKKDLVILMIEFGKSDEIPFEMLFEAAAGADDSCARGVEARVHQSTALGIGEPSYTLHDEVESKQNLDSCQNVKEYFHASRE